MFEVEIDKSTPYNFENILTLKYSDQNYNDFQLFTLLVNPSYENAQVNNINMTVTSSGNLGFNDYPDNVQGTGFRYKLNPDNVLFEGALMFGTSAYKLSDAARASDQSLKDDHFKILKSISFSKGNYSDEEGNAAFNDDNNPNKLNVGVNLNTYSYKSAPYDNFIILNYRFQNNNLTDLNNFYAGLFFDWDIGLNGNNNIAAYDVPNKLGYAYNTTGIPNIYTGVSLLNNTDKINYFPILNDDTSSVYFQIYDGFTTDEKFRSLSSRVMRQSAGPGDISMVLGAGPLTISAGGTVNVTFVILAGESLNNLQNSLQYAKEKFTGIKLSTGNQNVIPDSYYLYQNYPNPFNPLTMISYQLPTSGLATLKIYDITGREVATLVSEFQSAGKYNVSWNASGFSSGIYYCRFISGSFVDTKKLILLK
jgi:hypothetical protein